MESKSKILWITQGVGWGWDTRAKAISEKLFRYEHIIISRLTFENIINKIKEYNPDIIMAMSPSLLWRLRDYTDKVIATLPSFSAIGLLEQHE